MRQLRDLTPWDRRRIYIRMEDELSLYILLCNTLGNVLNSEHIYKSGFTNLEIMRTYFPELYAQRPDQRFIYEHAVYSEVWFGITDRQSRIDCINNAIRLVDKLIADRPEPKKLSFFQRVINKFK